MQYIKINGVDKPLSNIAIGTGGFNLEKEDNFNTLLDMYTAAGGNVLDTARIYGFRGAGETLLANWLHKRGKRDDVFVINKCCSPFLPMSGIPDENRGRVHPELITEDLAISLDKMGLEYFDFYLVHRDNPSIPVGDLMDRLEFHHKEGKFRYYGLSNWERPRIVEAVNYCKEKGYAGITLLEPSYSLATVKTPRWRITTFISDEDARFYSDMELPIASYSPLGAGFFAGVYFKEGANVSEGIRNAYFNDENMEKFKRAELLANEKGLRPENIALMYILNQGLLLTAIIGAKRIESLQSSLSVADLKLSKEEIEYLSLRSDTL